MDRFGNENLLLQFQGGERRCRSADCNDRALRPGEVRQLLRQLLRLKQLLQVRRRRIETGSIMVARLKVKTLGQADRTHRKAVRKYDLLTVANYHLARTAADIHNRALAGNSLKSRCSGLKRKLRLAFAADYIHAPTIAARYLFGNLPTVCRHTKHLRAASDNIVDPMLIENVCEFI